MHTDLREQIEFGELAEQPFNALEAGDPVQRGVEGDTDYPLRLQCGQRVEADIRLDHCYALEPPLPAGQRMQQAAIVSVVAAVGPHQQGVLYTVGVHHTAELFWVATS